MKKYLNVENVFAALFMIGTIVVSVALVCVSYDETMFNPEWLNRAMRVAGFAGSILLPAVYYKTLVDYVGQFDESEAE